MQDRIIQANTGGVHQLLFLLSGVVAIVVGLIGAGFGSAWSPQVYNFFSGIEVMVFIDSFMPYFPLVPFYPIFIIMMGTFLIVKSRG